MGPLGAAQLPAAGSSAEPRPPSAGRTPPPGGLALAPRGQQAAQVAANGDRVLEVLHQGLHQIQVDNNSCVMCDFPRNLSCSIGFTIMVGVSLGPDLSLVLKCFIRGCSRCVWTDMDCEACRLASAMCLSACWLSPFGDISEHIRGSDLQDRWLQQGAGCLRIFIGGCSRYRCYLWLMGSDSMLW